MKPIVRADFRDHLHRKFVRFKFRVDAEACLRSKSIPCCVTDISCDGMFIEFADPPREGTILTLRLALNVPLRFHCVVQRVVPGSGVGVTARVASREKRRFEALLSALSLGADAAALDDDIVPQQEEQAWIVPAFDLA